MVFSLCAKINKQNKSHLLLWAKPIWFSQKVDFEKIMIVMVYGILPGTGHMTSRIPDISTEVRTGILFLP